MRAKGRLAYRALLILISFTILLIGCSAKSSETNTSDMGTAEPAIDAALTSVAPSSDIDTYLPPSILTIYEDYPTRTLPDEPDSSVVDYSSVVFMDKSGTKELMLGMQADELVDIIGVVEENGWLANYDGIDVMLLNEHAAIMSIGKDNQAESGSWLVGGKYTIGDSIEIPLSIYGEPLVHIPDSVFNNQSNKNSMVFFFSSDGAQIKDRMVEYAYLYDITYDSDGLITSLTISTLHHLSANVVKGKIAMRAAGSGDSTLVIDKVSDYSCFDISYKGSGDFMLIQRDKEVFKRTGNYTGRILFANLISGEFEIHAEGEWSIKSIATYGLQNPPYSGNTDYVTPQVLLNQSCKLQITYDGEGDFIVRHISSMPDYSSVILVDTSGAYSGVVELSLDDVMNPSFFEILSDSNWTITLVE